MEAEDKRLRISKHRPNLENDYFKKTYKNLDNDYTVDYFEWDFVPIWSRIKDSRTRRYQPEEVAEFFAIVSSVGALHLSAKHASVNLNSIRNNYIKYSKPLQVAFNDCCEYYTDLLELEATRRAFEGCEKQLYYQGCEIGTETVYSDSLAIAILKKRRPEFRDTYKTQEGALVNSGVLVVREKPKTFEDWEQK